MSAIVKPAMPVSAGEIVPARGVSFGITLQLASGDAL